jgi:hypothetical protein
MSADFKDIPKNESIIGISDLGGKFDSEENGENLFFSFYGFYYF